MQIALFRETNFLGKLVTFFTRGDYSHCSLILDDGTVIEAKPFRRVRILKEVTEGAPKGCYIDLFDIDLTPQQKYDIEQFMRWQIGKKYDYWSVLAFVFLTSKPRKRDSNRWFCSEIIFAAFQYAGVNLLERVAAWKVAPVTLAYSTHIRLGGKVCVR